MYTKLLFVSYPPNIQTIICGEILGEEPKSTCVESTLLAMAFVGSVAGRKMESKTLGPCTPKLYT